MLYAEIVINPTVSESTEFVEINTDLNYHEIIDPYNWLKQEVASYVLLNNNWDGYGAIPVFEEIANKAIEFITSLNDTYIDKISDIFPNPTGTITIEFENLQEEKLSLEIGRNNYSYFINYNDKAPKLVDGEDITADLKNITIDIAEVFSNEIPNYLWHGEDY